MPLDNLLDRVCWRSRPGALIRAMPTSAPLCPATTRSGHLLCNHNLSPTATYRITGGNDASFATYSYDSGWLDVWPIDKGASEWTWLEWEDDRFWAGTYSGESVKVTAPAQCFFSINQYEESIGMSRSAMRVTLTAT